MAQKNSQKNSQKKQQQHDYCLLIDGFKYNRNIACKAHDNAYGIKGGGGERQRIEADKALLRHMRAHKDPLAWIAYFWIRSYGWLFFNYQKTMPWRGQLVKKINKFYHALFKKQ